MKIAILQFGGTNCDQDVLHVLKDVVGVDAETVWYKQEDLTGFDGVSSLEDSPTETISGQEQLQPALQ